MSALVILECNNCGAISAPWPTAEKARDNVAPDGWAVDVTGDGIDYCPQCTAPASAPRPIITPPASRVDIAREGIEQLRDAFAGISAMVDFRPSVVISVANLARRRADELLTELAS